MLENRVVTALSKYQPYIDYIHISDQYSGQLQQEDANNLKQPDIKPVILCGFNLPKSGDYEIIKPLLILVFYLMERLKVYRMSKEVRTRIIPFNFYYIIILLILILRIPKIYRNFFVIF